MSPHSTLVPLPHALVAELVRRYWVLGIECSMLNLIEHQSKPSTG